MSDILRQDDETEAQREERERQPKRFRFRTPGIHPNGSRSYWRYGCYFPLTDLCVFDMGERGTGQPPDGAGLEWLD